MTTLEPPIGSVAMSEDIEIHVRRFPSITMIALAVAPLVRLGHITEREGRRLIGHRYKQRFADLQRETRGKRK